MPHSCPTGRSSDLLMLPFEHRFKDDGGEGIDKARAQRPQPIVYMTGAVLVAILAVTPWLGTFLAMVVAAVVIPLLRGERRYGILTAFAIGLPLDRKSTRLNPVTNAHLVCRL